MFIKKNENKYLTKIYITNIITINITSKTAKEKKHINHVSLTFLAMFWELCCIQSQLLSKLKLN